MFGLRLTGFSVSVRVFGKDGWEVGEKQSWSAKKSDETLARFLLSSMQLSGPEATDLASQLQGQWRDEWLASGGRQTARWAERVGLGILSGVALLILLALVGVAFLVWLLVTQA